MDELQCVAEAHRGYVWQKSGATSRNSLSDLCDSACVEIRSTTNTCKVQSSHMNHVWSACVLIEQIHHLDLKSSHIRFNSTQRSQEKKELP